MQSRPGRHQVRSRSTDNPDGRTHERVLLRELLHADGAELERAFEDRGLRVAPDRTARRMLRECLAGARIARRLEIVDRAGWHRALDGGGFAYALLGGGGAFGPGAGRILLRTGEEACGAGAFAAAGTLPEWQGEVAALAPGNDLLALAIASAFAGPLLDIVGMRSFGAHLAGASSSGKTALARAAASVWGPPETGVAQLGEFGDEGAGADSHGPCAGVSHLCCGRIAAQVRRAPG